MTLEEFWQEAAARHGFDAEESWQGFDPAFYLRRYPDLADADLPLDEHYEQFGKAEGRLPSRYAELNAKAEGFAELIDGLVTDPGLKALLAEHGESARELAYALIRKGDPVDRSYTAWSELFYTSVHPDIAAANAQPFEHYVSHGRHEGRRSFSDALEKVQTGNKPFDPDKPTCIIGVHELSRTGAPIVGRDIAEEASRTHNVMVLARRGGPLLPDVLDFSFRVCISEKPAAELPLLVDRELALADFAILNSVEASVMLPPLVEADIPVAAYIHEFTEYSFPSWKAIFTAGYCDLLVYSSDLVRSRWEYLLRDLRVDIARDTWVLPQRPVKKGSVTKAGLKAARDAISSVLNTELGGRRLVVGAGQVSARKGTDAFIMAAQLYAHGGDDAEFVWIGSEWNHEQLDYGVWLDARLNMLREHHERAGTRANFHLLPAGPHYLDLMQAADVFFLSSVLDPLPNVVFDAVERDCEVVYFAGVTGFDDEIYTRLGYMHKVPFGDLQAVADTIREVPRKSAKVETRAKAASGARPAFALKEAEAFDLFGQIKDRLLAVRAQLREPGAAEDAASYTMGATVLFPDDPKDAPSRAAEAHRLARSGRTLFWRSADEVREAAAASSEPVHAKLRVETLGRLKDDPPPFHIHCHAYYIESFSEMAETYAAFRKAASVVLTTDQGAKAERLAQMAAEAGIQAKIDVVSNVGRDILPFMEVAAKRPAGEIWGHFHLKESRHTMGNAEGWRDFLFGTLLGDASGLTNALAHIGRNGVGLVSALDPNIVEWRENRKLVAQLQPYFDFELPDRLIAFPVGNMFWVRSEVVSHLLGAFGDDYPWPKEPLATDRTVFHFIERIWPAAAAHLGFESVFLDSPDLKRN